MEKTGFAISLGVKEFQSRAEVTVSFLGQGWCDSGVQEVGEDRLSWNH